MSPPAIRHILVLVDRDWSHPQAGGGGGNIGRQVRCWLEWGYRVTVVAGAYPGARGFEREDALTIRRLGGRATVFPRAIAALLREGWDDVDAVLEIVNGITFLTPLWLRAPVVVHVHHVHARLYVEEFGLLGRPLAFALETVPLRHLYRQVPFTTVSHASAEELVALGIARERIALNPTGLDMDDFWPGARSTTPTLVYLGRLKAYKRIELLLEVLLAIPGLALDIIGEGDHRLALEDRIRRCGLTDRVRLHGFVDADTKRRLLQRAWINVTASSAEGWCLAVSEAAACATPTVALAVGGLRESVAHGETGLLADDVERLIEHVRTLSADHELRERMGRAACAAVSDMHWTDAAQRSLVALEAERRQWNRRAAPWPTSQLRPATLLRLAASPGSMRNRGR